jgi:hypothetical protein
VKGEGGISDVMEQSALYHTYRDTDKYRALIEWGDVMWECKGCGYKHFWIKADPEFTMKALGIIKTER